MASETNQPRSGVLYKSQWCIIVLALSLCESSPDLPAHLIRDFQQVREEIETYQGLND
jgi:hypothetical protein